MSLHNRHSSFPLDQSLPGFSRPTEKTETQKIDSNPDSEAGPRFQAAISGAKSILQINQVISQTQSRNGEGHHTLTLTKEETLVGETLQGNTPPEQDPTVGAGLKNDKTVPASRNSCDKDEKHISASRETPEREDASEGSSAYILTSRLKQSDRFKLRNHDKKAGSKATSGGQSRAASGAVSKRATSQKAGVKISTIIPDQNDPNIAQAHQGQSKGVVTFKPLPQAPPPKAAVINMSLAFPRNSGKIPLNIAGGSAARKTPRVQTPEDEASRNAKIGEMKKSRTQARLKKDMSATTMGATRNQADPSSMMANLRIKAILPINHDLASQISQFQNSASKQMFEHESPKQQQQLRSRSPPKPERPLSSSRKADPTFVAGGKKILLKGEQLKMSDQSQMWRYRQQQIKNMKDQAKSIINKISPPRHQHNYQMANLKQISMEMGIHGVQPQKRSLDSPSLNPTSGKVTSGKITPGRITPVRVTPGRLTSATKREPAQPLVQQQIATSSLGKTIMLPSLKGPSVQASAAIGSSRVEHAQSQILRPIIPQIIKKTKSLSSDIQMLKASSVSSILSSKGSQKEMKDPLNRKNTSQSSLLMRSVQFDHALMAQKQLQQSQEFMIKKEVIVSKRHKSKEQKKPSRDLPQKKGHSPKKGSMQVLKKTGIKDIIPNMGSMSTGPQPKRSHQSSKRLSIDQQQDAGSNQKREFTSNQLHMANELIKEQLLNESRRLDIQLEQEKEDQNYDNHYFIKKSAKTTIIASFSGHSRPNTKSDIQQQKKKLQGIQTLELRQIEKLIAHVARNILKKLMSHVKLVSGHSHNPLPSGFHHHHGSQSASPIYRGTPRNRHSARQTPSTGGNKRGGSGWHTFGFAPRQIFNAHVSESSDQIVQPPVPLLPHQEGTEPSKVLPPNTMVAAQKGEKKGLQDGAFIVNQNGDNGGMVKVSRAKPKYYCQTCHKQFLKDLEEYFVVEGDVEVPKIVDHLSRLRVYNRVKEVFQNEVKQLTSDFKQMKEQTTILKRVLAKAVNVILESEMKNSTQDLRTLYAQDVTQEQIDKMAEFMEEDESLHRPMRKKPRRMPSAFLAFNSKSILTQPACNIENNRPSAATSGEEDTTDDPDSRTIVNPLVELGLLNEYIDKKGTKPLKIEVDLEEFNRVQQELQQLKEENEMLKMQQETLVGSLGRGAIASQAACTTVAVPGQSLAKTKQGSFSKRGEEPEHPRVNLEFPEELFYLLMTKREILEGMNLTDGERETEVDNFFAQIQTIKLKSMGKKATSLFRRQQFGRQDAQDFEESKLEDFIANSENNKTQSASSRSRSSPWRHQKLKIQGYIQKFKEYDSVWKKYKRAGFLKFKKSNMNDPTVLQGFMRLLGFPQIRPYTEVMTEVSNHIETKLIDQLEQEKYALLEKVENFKAQLKDYKIEPNESYLNPVRQSTEESQNMEGNKSLSSYRININTTSSRSHYKRPQPVAKVSLPLVLNGEKSLDTIQAQKVTSKLTAQKPNSGQSNRNIMMSRSQTNLSRGQPRAQIPSTAKKLAGVSNHVSSTQLLKPISIGTDASRPGAGGMMPIQVIQLSQLDKPQKQLLPPQPATNADLLPAISGNRLNTERKPTGSRPSSSGPQRRKQEQLIKTENKGSSHHFHII